MSLAFQTRSQSLRAEAIRRLGLLDHVDDHRFDRVIRLAQKLFDVPVVAINIVDDTAQHTIAAIGKPTDSLPLSDSVCSTTVEQTDALVLNDARQDERFQQSSLVTGEFGMRFYAGHPLVAPSGQRVGVLCVADSEVRDFSRTELEILADLAAWAEDELIKSDDLLESTEVQERLLPQRKMAVPGFDFAGGSVAQRHVSGDYFDWQELDDGIQIVLADVMGKGLTAAVIAAGVRGVMRGVSRFNTLAESFRRLSISLIEDLDDSGCLVTMFAARVDPHSGRMEWIDAGHGLTVILNADGSKKRWLGGSDLPLGVSADPTYEVHTDVLGPGETLLIASDGLLDFFESPRLALDYVTTIQAAGATPAELVDQLLRLSNLRPHSDDVTVTALRRWPN